MMKIEITKKVQEYFRSYKEKYNKPNDGYSTSKTFFGKLWWTTPSEVIWLYSTDNIEDYEGSQTQIGIKKDGTVVWAFFSHCSCYWYGDYEGGYKELEDNEDTFKCYEMTYVDKEVLLKIKKRLKEMSRLGLKDEA